MLKKWHYGKMLFIQNSTSIFHMPIWPLLSVSRGKWTLEQQIYHFFFFAKKINYNLGILELVLFMNELSVSMILIICMTLTLVSNFHIKGFIIALNEVWTCIFTLNLSVYVKYLFLNYVVKIFLSVSNL